MNLKFVFKLCKIKIIDCISILHKQFFRPFWVADSPVDPVHQLLLLLQ